jgi:hypothetical protein
MVMSPDDPMAKASKNTARAKKWLGDVPRSDGR